MLFRLSLSAVAALIVASAGAQPLPTIITDKTPVPLAAPVTTGTLPRITGTTKSTPKSSVTPMPIPTMIPIGSNVNTQTTATTIVAFQVLSERLVSSLNLNTSETERLARLNIKYQPDLKGRAALEQAMMDFHRDLSTTKQTQLRDFLMKLPVPIDLFSETVKYGPTPYDDLVKKLELPLKMNKDQARYAQEMSRRYAPQFNGPAAYQRMMREISNGLTEDQRRELPKVLAIISKELPDLPAGVVPPTPTPEPTQTVSPK